MKSLLIASSIAVLAFANFASADDAIQPTLGVRMPTQYNVSCTVVDPNADYQKIYVVARGAEADLYAKGKSLFTPSVEYVGLKLTADATQYEVQGTLATMADPIDLDAKCARGTTSRINVMGFDADCVSD